MRIEVGLGMHQTGPITGKIKLVVIGPSPDDDDADRLLFKEDTVTWETPKALAGKSWQYSNHS